MTHSFKFSIRHLLIAVAAAAFIFWFVKNYYDSKNLAESQAQLRAAKIAGSRYLYEKLLSAEEHVIGKTIAEIPGLNELSMNPAKLDDHRLAELALQNELVRSAPLTPTQTAGSEGESAEGKSADSPQKPTYVSGDRALIFALKDSNLLPEGSHITAFYVYIRNDKVLAIFAYVSLVPS